MNIFINKDILGIISSTTCSSLTIISKFQTFIIIFIALYLIHFATFKPAICQFPTIPPISYYYTNPLYFSDYGYINSITEPFYYLGYGYKPPIEGNTLLGWNPFSPFLNAYSSYLYNFFDIPTYGYLNSAYQTTFPYQTLPGRGYPYARFVYPTYSYGSVNFYENWVNIQ